MNIVHRIRRDRSGVAALEFAFILPILATMFLCGTELTNYVITRMRVSQLALHIADNASRMGAGSVLVARRLTETDINDVLTGAGMQAGEIDLYNRGRVILSDLEPVASPNTTNRYRIVWQRCRGTRTTYTPLFGAAGPTQRTGMGPTGRQVTAPDFGATMFVEVHYDYRPLLGVTFAPSTKMVEIASMTVRERRDLTQVYNTEGATVSTC